MSKAFGLGLQVLLYHLLVHLAMQYCYQINLLSFKTTDTPNYRLNMTITSNNTISSITNVHKEILLPFWHIKVSQRGPNYEKLHYNGTIKPCDFKKFVKRVRVFRDITMMIIQPESGNFSFQCPMPAGSYVIQNIYVLPNASFLKYLYTPNSIYTLYGGVLSMFPNKQIQRLCSYEINATIIKMC